MKDRIKILNGIALILLVGLVITMLIILPEHTIYPEQLKKPDVDSLVIEPPIVSDTVILK